jgi:hypothetical protein
MNTTTKTGAATVTVEGVAMSELAARVAEAAGASPSDDVEALRARRTCVESLLEYCLDGVESDDAETRRGWCEYVDAVAAECP